MNSDGDELTRVLGDHDLEAEVGRGQYGVVWRGRHRQLQREVAVKQLTASSDEHAARFRREARILAQLDHAHVVRVFDYREDGDLRVIIMEHLGGGTLAERMRRGTTAETAVAGALAAASGLHEVHQQGILHRDVKPENLMFDARGTLKVTDFGVARDDPIDATALHLTHAGSFFGTPAFASPEQAGHALGDGWPPVSAASDQYSLAAVLYQALSGRLTHDDAGGAVALCNRRMHEEARPLREVAPAVPAEVSDAVMRALSRDPAARYDSCESFGVALALTARRTLGPDWLARSEVQIREAGPILTAASGPPPPLVTTVAEPSPPARSHHAWKGLALLALVVIAMVAGFLLRPDRSSGDDPGTSEGPLDLVEAWSAPTGAAVFSSPAVAPLEGAADGLVVVGSDDGIVHSFDASTGRVVWERPTEDKIESSPTVSGDHVFVGSDDGNLYDLSLAAGTIRWKAPIGAPVISSPAVSGDTVVVGSANQLYAFDTQGHQRWTFPTGADIISSPAISEGTVFVGSNDGNLYAVDLITGRRRWAKRTDGQVLSSPTVAGTTVFVGDTGGTLHAFATGTGREQWSEDLGSAIKSSALVADGMVIVGTLSGRLVAQDAASGTHRWTFTAAGGIDSSPTAVGDVVVVGSRDGNVYAVSLATGERRGTFTTGAKVLSSPARAAGGVVIGSHDGNVYRITGFG